MSEHFTPHKVIHTKSARQFLAMLRRSHPRWMKSGNQWVFRGQGDAEWELQPGAWRPEFEQQTAYKSYLHFTSTEAAEDTRRLWIQRASQIVDDPSHVSTYAEILRDARDETIRRMIVQKHVEFAVVRGFLEVADEVGLAIPGTWFNRYSAVRINFDHFAIEDEQHPFEPIVALAQHHGCMTRLLDWSRRPEYAAYFAACPGQPQGASELAVWGLNLTELAKNQAKSGVGQLMPFAVPRSDIGFLHRQEGLFIYVAGADLDFLIDGTWPRIKQIAAKYLVQITLPWSEAESLRKILYKEGIHRASLMPTFDNVQRMLTEVVEDFHKDLF